MARTSRKDADLHDRVMREFDDTVTPEQEERALSLQDRRFVSIAGAQWEGEWDQQFDNSIKVEVNKTAAGVEKIINDYRSNRVIVDFRPVGNDASEDTAEMLDGLFRADVYRSKGQQAFDNAFEEAVQGGRGAWRFTNEYEDEYDPDSDVQRIAIKAIVDADQCLFWDANAKLYDKSDARCAWLITAMSPKAFEKEWGKDAKPTWPQGLWKPFYDWYTPDVVRICEYYEVEDVSADLREFENRVTGERIKEYDLEATEVKDLRTEGWKQIRRKQVKRRRVHKWILSGQDVLKDCGYIAGPNIPIVPVYGKRWFIDNMERARGHVRLAKDPQRIYNSQVSKLVETTALSPIERPIFTPQQIAGHERSWADANIDRAPYSLINPLTDETGQIIQTNQVGMVTPPQLAPAQVALLQLAGSDINELTNADQGADQVKANVSAEAMDIAATRVDQKSFTYMDNFAQSMQRGGEIYQGMAPEVYFEEGREVETMGEEGEQATATLKEPFTDKRGRFSIRHDLDSGRYKVIASVTEATATRRDKTVKACLNGAAVVAATDPTLARAFTITAFMNMDGEGTDDLKSYLREQALQMGLVKPTEEEAQEIAEAQEGQQPDPQAQALEAVAQKEGALAQKAVADTAQSEAKTRLTEAQTVKTLAEAKTENEQPKLGLMDRMRNALPFGKKPQGDGPKPPAQDSQQPGA